MFLPHPVDKLTQSNGSRHTRSKWSPSLHSTSKLLIKFTQHAHLRLNRSISIWPVLS